VSGDASMTRAFDGLASRIDALGVRSVGFTSALVGEGVSTVALGAALSLAELRGDDVLLVDGTWLQPSLSEDAGLQSAPGLADRLANAAELDTTIQRTPGSRIAFMPIGDRTRTRPALRALGSFVANETGSFETVVVDLPPILAGESFVLPWAAVLDQICVVLREEATPLPLLRQALGRLHATNAPCIVLNRTKTSSVDVPANLIAVRT
jgi:succinoglycan biosynthesis transport protein ExoP